jgi:hypothetical protein
MRAEILQHYGPNCACCGEETDRFLTIDHKGGGGNQHKRECDSQGKPRGGAMYYLAIIKAGFPDDLQILCFNCNLGRQMNKGICPHKDPLP